MANRTAYEPAELIVELRLCLQSWGGVVLAVLFGSLARGTAGANSDLDIAIDAGRELSADDVVALVGALAQCTGRPVDLVDLRVVGEPLRGQILRHGIRIAGSDTAYGQLIARHVFDATDFLPLRERILAERRHAWIGK